MKEHRIFPYSWHIDSKEVDETIIRVYGLNIHNKNICIEIKDFHPFVYLELPSHIKWTSVLAERVINIINEKMFSPQGDNKPVKCILTYKKKLYYANINSQTNKYKKYPFLLLYFTSTNHIRKLRNCFRYPIYISGLGRYKLNIHEYNANPILQLCSLRNIPTAGWIKFKAKKRKDEQKKTICDYEYGVKYQYLNKDEETKIVPKPLILSFDIEVNSTNINAMPKPTNPGDKVFQISCVISRYKDHEKDYKKYILTLGEPNQNITGKDVTILSFPSEQKLLDGYAKFVMKHNPNIITGYNIFGFDIEYMLNRSNYLRCNSDFIKQSCVIGQVPEIVTIKWTSSAYGTQEYAFLDVEGRLFIDMLPVIKRDYKLDNYKLKTVGNTFIGESKDPLSAKGIFKCYRDGMKKVNGEFTSYGKKALGVVAKYCVQDSVLVSKLLEKLQVWIGLSEMATVVNTPIFYLYTKGQQIKVYSQVYKVCMHKGFVVEKIETEAINDGQYEGAYVFEPVPGVYDDVIPLDFKSLYPSIIIGYNICWSTIVQDNSQILDRDCHVIEWEIHQGCIHDTSGTKYKSVTCVKKRYRFIKEPKGILPELLENLLNTRASTKKDMKNLKIQLSEKKDELSDIEKEDIQTQLTVLDKRQLAFKVSANSAYGGMGTSKGPLAFMAGAESTTAMGRESVKLAAKLVKEKYRGEIVYGDSVKGDTPLILRDENGMIFIKQIDDIYTNWEQYDVFKKGESNRKYKQQSLVPYQVWTKGKWSNINRVIKHKTIKRIFRVCTNTGVIDVTEDHSLLDEQCCIVKPNQISLGNNLYHSSPILNSNFENPISKEEAFMMGIFFANGRAGKSVWCLYNNNKDHILTFYYNPSTLYECEDRKYKYQLVSHDKKKAELYRNIFYTKGNKVIPSTILSSSITLKEWFFNGYISGMNIKKENFNVFINEKVTAQSVYCLGKSLGYNFCISYSNESYNIFVDPEKIVRPNEIVSIQMLGTFDDYVYDLETVEGVFHAGIGSMVVKNTDSVYTRFPHLTNHPAKELWDYSEYVATEISKVFPDSLILEFEETIYKIFLILSKKRYMSLECGRDGVVSEKISKKGVLLARRDNSRIVREIYGDIIMKIFQKISKEEMENIVLNHIQNIFTRKYESKYFVITKSTGDIGSFQYTDNIDEYVSDIQKDIVKYRGEPKKDKSGNIITKRSCKIGSYKIATMLDENNKEERQRQLDLKQASNEKEYYLRCLPSQIQLAIKMSNRGNRVDVGSRIEFVVCTDNSLYSAKDAKLWEKLEDIDYYNSHSDILNIDTIYYLKAMVNPVDQVLGVIYNMDNFIKEQHKLRILKVKILEELKSYFYTTLKIED